MFTGIRYDEPALLTEIKKTFVGNFKPYYGWGTGTGDIRCPECGRIVGHLLGIPDMSNLDESKCIGFINFEHDTSEFTSCKNAGKKLDLSDLQLRDLFTNMIPAGIDEIEWEEKVIGPGMVYDTYLDHRWYYSETRAKNFEQLKQRRNSNETYCCSR